MNGDIHEKINTVNIWWEEIKFHVPVYLLKGKINTLIDAGPTQHSQETVASALKTFGVTPADINMLLLTHGHMDHIGGIPRLMESGKPKIYIHGEDAFFLNDPAKAFDLFYSIGTRILTGKDDLSEERNGFIKSAGLNHKPDKLVKDGDIISAGDGIDLRVVSIPGHTKGSVGYYWEKEGVLIAGDGVPCLGSPDGSLPIIMSLADYEKSVDLLLKMPLQVLVFTHGYRGLRLPPSTVRRGGEIKEYLQNSKEMVQRLMESLKAQAAGKNRNFIEITDKVIAGMPEKMQFRPVAKQFMPQFSVSTVYWGLSLV